MTAKVILNPYAGRWKASQLRSEVEEALKEAGLIYELVVTERPGHGLELAAQAVRAGFSPIVAVGGDGTISEIVNGIMQASGEGEAGPLGIMPLGTANDLVVNLGLSTDFKLAAKAIAEGKYRLVDLGQVNGRYFDNNSAVGLEPFVTLVQQRITWLRGTVRYLVATLIAVAQKPQWTMHIEWEGGEYHGPASLVTVGNGAVTGGLFYMTPHANPYDGKLTFVYGYMPTRRQILRLLPRTMKPGAGSYVEHADIHEVETTWLRIRSDQPMPLHADGEIQSDAIQEVEYKIIPQRLKILTSDAPGPQALP